MIAFDELDTFYFGLFRDQLHPSMRDIVIDHGFLHHAPEKGQIKTLHDLSYQFYHIYVPLVLDDIFVMEHAQLVELGKAWLLTIIDLIVTDHQLDQELPDLQVIPLVINQIRQQAFELYRHLLPFSSTFWDAYHHAHQLYWNTLAHENYCVDQHREPYTLAVMQTIAHGKAAYYRMGIHASGELSGRPDLIEPIQAVYDRLVFVDLLLDDAVDWEVDFQRGRYTVPIVQAAQIAQIPIDQLASWTMPQLEQIILNHQLQLELSQKAMTLLEESMAILQTHHYAESKIGQFIRERKRIAEQSVQRYHKLHSLNNFINRLG
ncbi:MAG: hypothetical protein MUF87_21275 [Anaerolineae bacterium]|jgi:hypothetical protein|nr:hypothetical protein [Anaerolineae bacterium]